MIYIKRVCIICYGFIIISVFCTISIFAKCSDNLRIHVLDVGEADSIIIQTPCDEYSRDKIMVVDVGEDKERDGTEAELVYDYIKNITRNNKVEYVMLTNYNEEHIGRPQGSKSTGIFYLLDKSNLQIEKIIDRGLEIDSNSSLDDKYRKWVNEEKVPRETVRWSYSTGIGKKQIRLQDNLYIDIIAFNTLYNRMHDNMAIQKKDEQVKSDENNFSIVFVLHYRRFDMYFGSDIPGFKNSKEGLVNISDRFLNRLKKVEVCKVADHGSNRSTRRDVLQRLMPAVSIISCGKGKENPHPQLLIRLLGYTDKKTEKPIGSDVFQTTSGDGWRMTKPFESTGKVHTVTNGNIIIETDGKEGFSIKYSDDNGDEIEKKYPMQKFSLN